MEHNENNDQIEQRDAAGSAEQIQVPSSLFPTVLHRLGLTPEQIHGELPVEEVVAKLRSDNWEERAMAVRLLGRLGAVAPVELLEAVLDDEDGSVRAAAVHAMGNVGKRAPLHRLVQALHDADWHVRETAVFALGNQGKRVPPEVLKTALYDSDSTVREAARFALQQHSPSSQAATDRRLPEEKKMQQNSDAIHKEQTEGVSPYDTLPYEVWSGNHSNGREYFQGVREQAQAYAPQESVPYEQERALPYGEKVTSYSQRRQSTKKWWVVIAVVALLFFILGFAASQSTLLMPRPFLQDKSGVVSRLEPPQKADPSGLLQRSQYGDLVRKQIAEGLHTTPDQISAQMKMGKSITDIATAQGVSQDQLNTLEQNAFSNALQQAVDNGDASQPEVDNWLAQNKSNPQALEKMTTSIFLSSTTGK